MDFDLQLFKAGGSHGRGLATALKAKAEPPSSTSASTTMTDDPKQDIRIRRSEMDALVLMLVATVSQNSVAMAEQVSKERALTKDEQESAVLAHVLLERVKQTFAAGEGVVEDTNDPLDRIIDEALGS